MVSEDLKQAIVQLQLAVLERLARRQGIEPDRAAIQEVIARQGIAAAYKTLNQPPAAAEPSPLPIEPPLAIEPLHHTEPEPTSLFRRLAQRWFGLG